MTVSYEAYKNVRVNPAIVAAAAELSQAHEAAKQDPRYLDLERRYGHQAAAYLVAHYGSKALSAEFPSATPAQMDVSKQIAARLEVFNWAASHMKGAPADAVERRAEKLWDGLSAEQRAQLAKDPGSGASILSDVGKGPLGLAELKRHAHGDQVAGDQTAGGQWVNGHWIMGADRASAQWIANGARDGGASHSSSAYASLGGSWNPSMGGAGLNSNNFGGTPFAAAGLDLSLTKSLYAQGFNQPQILAAANDTKLLGFSGKDKDVVKNQAIIRKYDKDADGTEESLRKLDGLENDNKDHLRDLIKKRDDAKTPEQKAAAQKELQEFHDQLAKKSGVKDREEDVHRHHHVRKAIKDTHERLVHKWEGIVAHHHKVKAEVKTKVNVSTQRASAQLNNF